VEPLIDMGRTAVNVSGSMTAGAVTSKWIGQTDLAVFGAADAASAATTAPADPADLSPRRA